MQTEQTGTPEAEKEFMDTSMEHGTSSVSKLKFYILGDEGIRDRWDEVEQALDRDPELWGAWFTKEDIQARLFAGLIQFWILEGEAGDRIYMMTQKHTPPNGISRLQVFWGVGENLKKYIQMIDSALDRFAAYANCAVIEGQGRKGFERLVVPLGYKLECVTYSRKVRIERGN